MAADEPQPHRGRVVTPPSVELFGVRFAQVSLDDTLELFQTLVAGGRSSGSTYQVATVNVDFLVNADADPSVAAILRAADVCLADGMPIVWAARLFGAGRLDRVAGSDLFPRLAAESARTGLRVHVFGARPEIAERARRQIADQHPGAAVTFDSGPMFDDPADVNDAVIDAIASADADVLCVALGNPKQELFIAAHRDRLGAPVQIGVGGSVDLFVGERRRAPRWVQRIGLEWVFRAVQEPGRLGPRYARDLRVFVPMVLRERRRRRRAATPNR